MVREYEALGRRRRQCSIRRDRQLLLAALSLIEDKKANLWPRLSGVVAPDHRHRAGRRPLWLPLHGGFRAQAATLRPRCCGKRIYPWLRITRILGRRPSDSDAFVSFFVCRLARGWRNFCAPAGVRVSLHGEFALAGAVSGWPITVHDCPALGGPRSDGLRRWMMHRN